MINGVSMLAWAVLAVDVVRGPYLQQGTPDSAIVRWRTDVPSDSRVTFGPAPDNLTFIVDQPTPTTEHAVQIDGLASDTTYYYAVGTTTQVLAGGDETYRIVTAPPPGTTKPIRIWVIGDSGEANPEAAQVYQAFLTYNAGAPTDVWLMLGDNAYGDGTDEEYQAAVFEMYPELLHRTFLWPTLGNHDGASADSPSESGPYYDIFSLPRMGDAGGMPSGTEAYYSFDWANIHFVCLNSFDVDRSPDGPMLTWLADDLASTTAEWIIAYWHHPPYSKGSHDSDDFQDDHELVEMRQNALPILEAAGVDLVLSGHSHSYERSVLLDGHYGFSNELVPENILDGGDGRETGDGAYLKDYGGHLGTVYAVAGSSSKTSGGDLDHPVMFVSLEQLGSMVIDIDGRRLDAAFLRETGVVDDHFTIIKGPVPPAPAAGPVPEDGAAPVPTDTVLTWSAGGGAESHDVYFGTEPAPGPAQFQGNQVETTFDPGALEDSTTYYWRIDEVNGEGTTVGDVWSFTTADPFVPTMQFLGINTAEALNASNVTLAPPFGTEAGDLLVAVIAREGGDPVQPATGWMALDEGETPGGDARLGVFYRIATANEPVFYIFPAGDQRDAVGAVLRYCCPSSDATVHSFDVATGTGAAPTAPPVTTTVPGGTVVRCFAAKDGSIAGNPHPPDHDGRFAGEAGDNVSGAAADMVQLTAGDTGGAAFTLTAPEPWRAATIVFLPAPIATCDGDVDGDGLVGVDDLVAVILNWGQPGGPADLNGDGTVAVHDLVAVITNWGPCTP